MPPTPVPEFTLTHLLLLGALTYLILIVILVALWPRAAARMEASSPTPTPVSPSVSPAQPAPAPPLHRVHESAHESAAKRLERELRADVLRARAILLDRHPRPEHVRDN